MFKQNLIRKLRNLKKPLLFILIGLIFLFVIFYLWPLPDSLQFTKNKTPLKLLDRNGQLLYEVRQNNYGSQSYLEYEEIPENVIRTLLAVEDRRFWNHGGISIPAIGRAVWQNIISGRVVSGGSTITQQLVRIRLNPEERTYRYKIKEMLLAIKLEQKMNKEEILEAYLNEVYFGQQAYGIQSASHIFFDKNISELSLAEMSFLIGLIQSPASYNPFVRRNLAEERHERVIGMLKDVGTFTDEEIDTIQSAPIHLDSGKVQIHAPHFVMWVTGQLSPDELEQDEIRTTLDFSLQKEVEQIVSRQLEKLIDKNVTSASVVVLDTQNGDILAMVGSADYFDVEHDGAVNVALASRQPGSALKPFTYALALERGDTPATTIADIETQFFTQEGNPYVPRNYDYGYHGLVRYREALANSYNISAIKVLEKVGVQPLMEFLKEAGITTFTETPEHYGLALTLGDAEVKLLELTQAYGMLARGGLTLPIRFKLDDEEFFGERILNEQVAWLITDILDDDEARLPQFGEGNVLEFDFPVAAKTGTTRNNRDNWTLGYTPEVVVGVWVGNADNSPMRGTSGITGAGPIFHEVMEAVQVTRPVSFFRRPSGLFSQEICTLSGMLPTEYCPHRMQEWFRVGTELLADQIYQPLSIDTRNGLLAGEDCDPEFVEVQVFAIFPPELQTWARENGWSMPPTIYSPFCGGGLSDIGESWIFIEKPHVNEHFLLDPLVPDENEKIIFQASASEDIQSIEWWLEDEMVCESVRPTFRCEWLPELGRFKITAKANQLEKSLEIQVDE